MNECFAITTYCNTEEKIRALRKTIEDIKVYGLPIFIHAHYPLPDDIQKKVHSYFYSSDNPVLKNRFNKFWYAVEEYELEITTYDYYFTTLKGWSESIRICEDYDKIHMINYDANITPELFNLSRKYDKSIFLQNPDPALSTKHILPTYFCIKKDSYEYFRENITMEQYLGFRSISTYKFLPLVEEFIPYFTIGDNFFIVPMTEYDANLLLANDIASDTRFDWNKSLTVNGRKVFIGEFQGSVGIIFFDIHGSTKVTLNVNNFIDEINIYSTHVFKLNMKYHEITSLKIKIDDVDVPEDLYNRLNQLESKIFIA